MKNRFAVVALILTAWTWQAADVGRAAVVVLSNRSEEEIRFTISSAGGSSREHTLQSGEGLALPTTRGLDITFSAGNTPRRCHLLANEAYHIVGAAKQLTVKQIHFAGSWGSHPKRTSEPGESATPDAAKPPRILLKIPVKILVDQAEPTVRAVWEKRLRQRVEEASAILERSCRVQLEVIAVGTWESDGRLATLVDLLDDFRRKVAARPARLVLGFTGRLAAKKGDTALGCTPGPLHSHILIREWKPRSEAERLEVLVHELGHFLGAAHSPEADSVMRPQLGDGRANLRAFRIGFDPINLLIVNLVAEEVALRPVRGLDDLRPETRARLIDIFSSLVRAAPDDPAAPKYVRLLGGTPPEPFPLRALPPAAVDGARGAIAAIVSAAEKNQQRGLSGDALTACYVRAAAAACKRLRPEQAAPAFLLGLAAGLDRTALLRSLPIRGVPWEKIESAKERAHRLQVLGEPSMRGRQERTRCFAVSAALAVLVEGQAVSAAGVLEEILRVQGGERFRFDDLTANLAGVAFATQLDSSPELLAELATSFRVADYLLPPLDAPDGFRKEQFVEEYGSTSDERFLRAQDALRKRLLALPGYQPRSKEP